MKIALLIPWSKPSTGEKGWQWQSPSEKELSKDFESVQEALLNLPQDYILLDDGYHRIEIKLCPHCLKPVIKSDLGEYDYQCLECDEDFYNWEVHEKGE